MCSNQLSYVAIFFSRYLIGVAGRIMRIGPASVNPFFNEKGVDASRLNTHNAPRNADKVTRKKDGYVAQLVRAHHS